MQLISELRRRQVFRTAAWYAAAAWCAVQVANTVVPELGLPEWSVRAVIVAAALGLPVALMLAWVFDPSVPGLRRESSAPASVDGAHGVATLWRIPSFWIALAKRRLGRFDEAIAHFREAARLMPAQPQHSLRVFETLEGLGRLAEAEQERKAFAQRFPDWRAPAELSGFHVRFLATGATDGWQEAYERLAPGLSPAIRSYFFGRLCLAAGDLAGYAAFVEAADRSERQQSSGRTRPCHRCARRPSAGAAVSSVGRGRDARAGRRAVDRRCGGTCAARQARRGSTCRRRGDSARPGVAVQRAWVLIRAGGERADEGYAELQRLLGGFRVQPRAFATYSLGVMLRDDARAHRIVQEAIERQDRAFAASGGFTSPAPVADPRP